MGQCCCGAILDSDPQQRGGNQCCCSSERNHYVRTSAGSIAVRSDSRGSGLTAKLPRSFWDWKPMIASNATGYFPYTSATNMLSGLREEPGLWNPAWIGPLAPRASNDTDEGRAQNRRVEAVLAPTQ